MGFGILDAGSWGETSEHSMCYVSALTCLSALLAQLGTVAPSLGWMAGWVLGNG